MEREGMGEETERFVLLLKFSPFPLLPTPSSPSYGVGGVRGVMWGVSGRE